MYDVFSCLYAPLIAFELVLFLRMFCLMPLHDLVLLITQLVVIIVEVGAESNFGNSSASVGDDNSIRRGSVSVSSSSADEPHIREQHPTIVQDQSTRNKIDVVIEQKRERLKLLGLVPIPGTKKMYDEDRREKKIESRKKDSKLSGYASWEAGLAAGGKL